jgi:signal transduction histidine kinase
MALTSEIISLHNGHMEITSQLGQGTQVTLWIPTADSKVELKAHG